MRNQGSKRPSFDLAPIESNVADFVAKYSNLSSEKWLDLLNSESARDRTVAARQIIRTGSIPEREFVAAKILSDPAPIVKMAVGPMFLNRNPECFHALLSEDMADARVVYALLMAARYQRRSIPLPILISLATTESVFVLLGLLFYVTEMEIDLAELESIYERLVSNSKYAVFKAEDFAPSPVFRSKRSFAGTLSVITRRLRRKQTV